MAEHVSKAPSAISAKAVIYAGIGGYETIGIGERQVRAPGAGEIRIKVAAAGVNPTDILLRDPGQGNVPMPITPGMDAAGIVEALGDGVDRFAVSDEVMVVCTPMRPDGGAQAAYLVISAASAVRKPANVSLVEAATLPMNGLTALYALDQAGLSAGQTFAVSGGAGWLAHQVTVLAKQRGLRVIADAKPQDRDLVLGYGADIVIERGADFAEAIRAEVPEGVDALLDTAVLGEESFAALKDGGVYIPVRGWPDKPDDNRIRIKPVLVYNVLDRTDWLETLRTTIEAGLITPRIAGPYAPEQAVDAQRLLTAGGVRGRPVIVF